jgi:3-isopropylmalate/(R)-2-methylmalate dehydratase small subunit
MTIKLRTGTIVKVFGNDISTDIIYPGTYLYCTDAKKTPAFCFKVNNDEAFNKRLVSGEIPKGSIILAGSNFGCGSSREQAASSIAGHGLVIVAKSFARIFLDNASRLGICTVIVPDIEANEGDELEIGDGKVRVKQTGKTYAIAPHQSYHQFLIDAGGLIPYAAELLRGKLKGEEV